MTNEDRIIQAVSLRGRATIAEIAEATDLEKSTVKNTANALARDEVLCLVSANTFTARIRGLNLIKQRWDNSFRWSA